MYLTDLLGYPSRVKRSGDVPDWACTRALLLPLWGDAFSFL